MRNVKENIGMGDKKSNTKGVSPHLIHYLNRLWLSLTTFRPHRNLI